MEPETRVDNPDTEPEGIKVKYGTPLRVETPVTIPLGIKVRYGELDRVETPSIEPAIVISTNSSIVKTGVATMLFPPTRAVPGIVTVIVSWAVML